MAATYGYGGEFSSDEDIDRMEQQSERLIQSKFDTYASLKPTKRQVEEAIETIRSLPVDQDVTVTDELLTGLLDHYKIQRGPIVDSTRNLYKKIVLRRIRGEQQLGMTSNGDSAALVKDSNGSNNNNNNNNNIVGNKRVVLEAGSSDEDEPMPPSSGEVLSRKKFDSSVVVAQQEAMEVDSDEGAMRSNKLVDSTSEDDDDDDDSETEESSSDSESLDITPVKPQAAESRLTNDQLRQKIVGTPIASPPQQQAMKKTPAPVTSTPKQSESAANKKKPYTRSQRVAATRTGSSSVGAKQQASSSSSHKTDVSSSSKAVDGSVKSSLSQSRNLKFKIFTSALLFAALASFLYFYFGSDLIVESSKRVLSRAIKFQ